VWQYWSWPRQRPGTPSSRSRRRSWCSSLLVSLCRLISVGGSSCAGPQLDVRRRPPPGNLVRGISSQTAVTANWTSSLLASLRSLFSSVARWFTARSRHRSPSPVGHGVSVPAHCGRDPRPRDLPVIADELDRNGQRIRDHDSACGCVGHRNRGVRQGVGQVDGTERVTFHGDSTGRVTVEGVRPGVRSPGQDGGPDRHASAGRNVTNHATSTGA
jgi:hypothetical protein